MAKKKKWIMDYWNIISRQTGLVLYFSFIFKTYISPPKNFKSVTTQIHKNFSKLKNKNILVLNINPSGNLFSVRKRKQ